MSQVEAIKMIDMVSCGAPYLSVKKRPFLQPSFLIKPVLLNVIDHRRCERIKLFETGPKCLLQLG